MAAQPLTEQEAQQMVEQDSQRSWWRELNRCAKSDPAKLAHAARILAQLLQTRRRGSSLPATSTSATSST